MENDDVDDEADDEEEVEAEAYHAANAAAVAEVEAANVDKDLYNDGSDVEDGDDDEQTGTC